MPCRSWGKALQATRRTRRLRDALRTGQTPKLTAGGTIMVVTVFALIGLSLALTYAALLRRRLPGKGISYGLLLAALTWYLRARQHKI